MSCGLKTCWGVALEHFVGVWLGCAHVSFCVCFPYVLALSFVKCWLGVVVDSVFGVCLGQSCGLTTRWGFPLANFVGVGVGCVHASWFVCCLM